MGDLAIVGNFNDLKEYQRLLRKRVIVENKLDRKIDILSIINTLTAGPKNLVQKEQLLIEASNNGFSDSETEALLEELIKENIIYESAPGYIKKRE